MFETNSTPGGLSENFRGQTGWCDLISPLWATGWSHRRREQWICPGSKGRFHRDVSAGSSFRIPDLMSFEPDRVAVYLDGVQLRLEAKP